MKANWKIALMAIATLAFVACDKKQDPKHNTDDDDTDEYVAPITIDGSDSEWAALGDKVASAKCAANCSAWQALKSMKVYADEVYVYIYAEYDASKIDITEDLGDAEFTTHPGVPFHVYFNTSKSSNGYIGQWSSPCEILMEGFLYEAQQPTTYEPSAFTWTGETASSEWNWGESTATNFMGASKVTANSVELSIVREALATNWGSEFTIGLDIQQAWDSKGVLPNADDNEAGAVLCDMLTAKVNK